jgi:hypothetical protein
MRRWVQFTVLHKMLGQFPAPEATQKVAVLEYLPQFRSGDNYSRR